MKAQLQTEAILDQTQNHFLIIQQSITSVKTSITTMSHILNDISSSKDHLISNIHDIHAVAEETIGATDLVEDYAHTQVVTLQELVATSEDLKERSFKLEDLTTHYQF